MLSQYVDGKEHVVAYASLALSKVERQYCVTWQEMLALVWAVKHFVHTCMAALSQSGRITSH